MPFLLLGLPTHAAPLTPGNLVVYRVGDGVGSLINTGNPVFLDEYTPAGVLVQSLALPTTSSGPNRRLVASGTATSEGLLAPSADQRFLFLTGYDSVLPSPVSLSGTASVTVNRVVGRVDASGNIDTTTALTDGSTGNNPRSATSTDGANIWFTGGAGGIRATTLGATTSTQISTTVTNLRQLNIFNSQLYTSTSSGSAVRLGTVGTGTPTAAGQTITNLPGFPLTGSPYAFFFADLSPQVPGVDTVYVADDTSTTGGLLKFSLVGGTWTASGTAGAATDAYRGLTGVVNGSTVTLYATRRGGSGSTGGGELVTLVDASGYNGSLSGTPALIRTAVANTAFRGIALAPTSGTVVNQPVSPTCPVTLSTPLGSATSATVSATDSDDIVTNIAITSVAVAGISLTNITPAQGLGGTASATLNVDSTVAQGSHAVTLTFTNSDSPTPQTATCTVSVVVLAPVGAQRGLVNFLTIAGNAADLTPAAQGSGGNVNRLGGFVSDLYYASFDSANSPATNTYVFYGVADRGPGGGTIAYDTRVQKFSVTVNPTTGAISDFRLLATTALTIPAGMTVGGITFPTATPFNGFNPSLDPLNGNSGVLGRSHDPEGLVVLPDGSFYVADEYGPSIYHFTPTGVLDQVLTVPSLSPPVVNAPNVIAKVAGGAPEYVAGRPTIVNGRQDNRGFEGLTLSADGSRLWAILQDPLVNEGSSNDGRNSRNLRLLRFDTTTGRSDGQFIYVLEDRNLLNSGLPPSATTFSATNQGRSIGISAITALNDNEFLVIERDNRGLGVDDPFYTTDAAQHPLQVSEKRVYKINIAGATNVSNLSLANTNTLPAGVVPVAKRATPFLDLNSAILAAGNVPAEKIEGIAVGPQLADGSRLLLLGTDNDFSVTQNSSSVQFDVCSNFVDTSTQVPLDTPCPTGQSLLPTYLYAFRVAAADLALTPTITSFTPAGAVGSTVTINGSGFTGTTAVGFFNNLSASFTVVSDNQITAVVPVGAATGKIRLTTPGGRLATATKFRVN
ncbi:esterase-like activity of phytase family protein [Anthocerotibacter panamensis]|uniref:esterase-like activity of phytase family protein n=1 Tax=Anthocerotibacter panamensis TaxID=2857077 RepID=UPI001C406FAC|nr:esterase-like activity of phytase family protein [Anthocerotibacter panamensis]